MYWLIQGLLIAYCAVDKELWVLDYKWDIYISLPTPQAQNMREWKKVNSWRLGRDTMKSCSLGHNMSITPMNSQKLWLYAQVN